MTTVAVAMSGGVDSTTAAALLLESGYEVFGLTMETGFSPPVGPAAAEAARRLGIEHHTVDLGRRFREAVVYPFCRDYEAGRTPNPCVVCNRCMKFGDLLSEARNLGARFLATGHYARVERGADNLFHLLKGHDRRKDQSYFLYSLGQEELSCTLFPLGRMTKSEVRRFAAERGLPVASRPESQDVCFIPACPAGVGSGAPGSSYAPFIQRITGRQARPGPIIDLAGKRVGTHRGLIFYTVGQRRGLALSAPDPLYVVALRPEANELVVGPAEATFSGWLEAERARFVCGRPLPEGLDLGVRIRYRSRETAATLSYPPADEPPADGPSSGGPTSGRVFAPPRRERFRLELTPPQRAVAPGQSAVLYRGDEVLGGGVITRTEASARAAAAVAGGSLERTDAR